MEVLLLGLFPFDFQLKYPFLGSDNRGCFILSSHFSCLTKKPSEKSEEQVFLGIFNQYFKIRVFSVWDILSQ
jgi:hypothetical protein